MSDSLAVIWELEPHTQAKHAILTAYLNAWAPILARQASKLGKQDSVLRVIDGFAGPGIYKGGELGSPILALKALLGHEVTFPAKVRFLFIEKDRERFQSLESQLEPLKSQIDESKNVDAAHLKNGDCEDILVQWLDRCDSTKENPGPAFFFLDQFGYSHVSMNLVKRIMSYRQCEVFTYLNWARMNQFLSDKSKWGSINAAYGGEEWQQVATLPNPDRQTFMREMYKKALKEKARAKHVCHFAMCDQTNKLVHWLFFCTQNDTGLEVMKKSMWSVDDSGCFQFSDRNDPDQFDLFKNYSDTRLAEDIQSEFAGKVIAVRDIKLFVLAETPAYLYKAALRQLELVDKVLVPVDPPAKRRRGEFPDGDMKVRFW